MIEHAVQPMYFRPRGVSREFCPRVAVRANQYFEPRAQNMLCAEPPESMLQWCYLARRLVGDMGRRQGNSWRGRQYHGAAPIRYVASTQSLAPAVSRVGDKYYLIEQEMQSLFRFRYKTLDAMPTLTPPCACGWPESQ
jgi:hypothetical protein